MLNALDLGDSTCFSWNWVATACALVQRRCCPPQLPAQEDATTGPAVMSSSPIAVRVP